MNEDAKDRLEELAQHKAAAALMCPMRWAEDIKLEDAPTPPGGGWAFIASYGGRSVTVEIAPEALEE